MGLQGFTNNSSGGTSPGDPLFAKSFNNLAANADKAQVGPSPNAIFQSTNGGMAMYFPAERNDDLTDTAVEPTLTAQQFELSTVSVEVSPNVFVNKLRLAKGTAQFTQSNMPRVRLGAHYNQCQAWIRKTAVLGNGITATQGIPSGIASKLFMESGGYYNITSPGVYWVTISKFDITSTNDDTESSLLNEEVPWVSIFKSGDPIESIIFSETGPSEYVNKMNMQKMDGYSQSNTNLSGDWGNCHTTYFNPVKWGYCVKVIGTVTASTQVGSTSLVLTIDQDCVGPIDLSIPVHFNGSTLCNQTDLNEANDPYNLNKNADPAWSDIVNSDTLTEMNELEAVTTDWYDMRVGPQDWTSYNYSYLIPASCANQDDGESCLFPFQMKPRELTVASPEGPVILYRANVCAGMVNNLIPWNRPGPSKVKLPTTIDFGYGGPGVSEARVYLRLGTEGHDTDTPVFPVEDDSSELYPTILIFFEDQYDQIPQDDDLFCYLMIGVARNIGDPENFTIDQMISGSLWVDRIKMGNSTAQYFWARL
jgi:hypothetical protein